MMKKLIAALAIFSLVSVSAAVPQQTLTQAINEFNFAVTVEWNQVDSDFYNKAVKKFRVQVIALTKAGMTNEQVITGVLKNTKITNEIKSLLNIVNAEEMTKREAVNFVLGQVSTNHNTGASFAGRRRRNRIIAGILVGIIITIIIVNNNDDEVIIEEDDSDDYDEDDYDYDYDDYEPCYDWEMEYDNKDYNECYPV